MTSAATTHTLTLKFLLMKYETSQAIAPITSANTAPIDINIKESTYLIPRATHCVIDIEY